MKISKKQETDIKDSVFKKHFNRLNWWMYGEEIVESVIDEVRKR